MSGKKKSFVMGNHSTDNLPPFLPEQSLIDAYGNGGFRFGEMSHKGSLLFLPSGVYGWSVPSFKVLEERHLLDILNRPDADSFDFLLLGTGHSFQIPSPSIFQAFEKVGKTVEPMDTGAACRTYNILLEEKRPVAAAIIAVEDIVQ